METSASFHFKNYKFCAVKNKHFMTCKYCSKELVDSKNTTCKVSHLARCRPEKHALLTNSLKNFPKQMKTIEIEICNTPIKVYKD